MKGYIYKITCLVNNKVYIGLTTTSIAQRWKGHIGELKRSSKHLYASMRKYGIDNFKIEQIDETDDFEKLGELERYYIKEYNSTDSEFGYNNTSGGEKCQLDGNPRAKLTVEDVEHIRILYNERKMTCSQCWSLYENRISFSAFEKVWQGVTWKSVLPEVYTEENKRWHKNNSTNIRKGENNVNSIYTDKEVIEIREYYVDHSLDECFKKYGAKSKSKKSFRNIIDRGYKHLPIYKKNCKEWIYQDSNKKNTTRSLKENEFTINDDILYIKVYNDLGNESKIFFTNSKFYDALSNKLWHFYSSSLATVIDGVTFSIKDFIINANKYEKIYHIDGNIFNLMEENLTKDKCDIIFKGVDKSSFFEDFENLSMRKMKKKYNTTEKNIKDFYKKHKK